MPLYYQDDAITLYHGDCREVLAGLDEKSMDHVITDPPYSAATHKGARTRLTGASSRELIDFAEWSDDDLIDMFGQFGRVARRWVLGTLDWKHTARLEQDTPDGLRFVRAGVWVKPNSTPQLTGDRPAQGWESIGILHTTGERLRWNGGGKRAVWTHNVIPAKDHPTAKPVPLFADFVRLFTDPGDVILDPFAGSGTTLRAAADEGRKAIGVEMDEKYCELIARRLSQGVLDFAA